MEDQPVMMMATTTDNCDDDNCDDNWDDDELDSLDHLELCHGN